MTRIPLNFLGAHVPLTKVFRKNGSKESYPLVKNFTSYHETVANITEFHDKIVAHALKGNCLLKGALTRTLNNEPRANSTRTDDSTRFICLDFDRHETPDLDHTLKKLGLGDVSYVIQFSSSHGLPENMGTISAHVFMLLDQPMPAPVLKAWLMALNLDHMSDIKLSRTSTVLSWPLDITTCQNDKLLYIAPPVFEAPLTDPLHNRIKLVKRKKGEIATATVIGERNINALKVQAREKLNELREFQGLPKRTAGTSWVGTYEVENKPDVCHVTEVKDCGDYIRLNINNGDSFAYWHPKENFELIHDFKTGSVYRTKELVPGYYATVKGERETSMATPSESGDLILAFRDLNTSEYYNGLWNPETQKLMLHRARDTTQLAHWWMSHGHVPPDFVPTWNIMYDPNADWIVDEEKKLINTFRKSEYMRMEPDKTLTPRDFPNIYHIIKHFLGESEQDSALSDHFLNWFAVIFQRKAKPLTAWVNHGVQGTGKGYFMTRVVTPLFGKNNVIEVGIGNIEDQFNGWLEGKLFVNVNEIDVNDFGEKGRVEAKFKMLITDTTMPVRRMRQTMTSEPNYASFLFSSNKTRPVMIPADDRRHNVGHRQTVKLVPPKESDVEEELESFAKWLLAHKADVKLANQILHTEARAAMQKLGVNSIEESCNAIQEGDFDFFWMNMHDEDILNRAPHLNEDARTYNMLVREIGKRIVEEGVRQTLSRDEMGIILKNSGRIPPEPNKLTSLLRHNGIETKQVRHKGRKTYGVHVTWKISDEILNDLSESLGTKPKLRRAK